MAFIIIIIICGGGGGLVFFFFFGLGVSQTHNVERIYTTCEDICVWLPDY